MTDERWSQDFHLGDELDERRVNAIKAALESELGQEVTVAAGASGFLYGIPKSDGFAFRRLLIVQDGVVYCMGVDRADAPIMLERSGALTLLRNATKEHNRVVIEELPAGPTANFATNS